MQTEQATVVEGEISTENPSSYQEALKPEAPAGDTTGKVAQENADPEVEIELAGKKYSGKARDLQEALEFRQKLVEKERNLDKGYTQKFQSLAAEQKKWEEAFGRKLEDFEIRNLAKLAKHYQTHPNVRTQIDNWLMDKIEQANQQEQKADPKVLELEQKVEGLLQSLQEREQAKVLSAAKQSWEGWVKAQETKGIKITDEIDEAMSPFIQTLKNRHPEWDNQKLLDTAYRHATIDSIEHQAVNKAIQKSESLQKATTPRISSKAPTGTLRTMSYKDIVNDSI